MKAVAMKYTVLYDNRVPSEKKWVLYETPDARDVAERSMRAYYQLTLMPCFCYLTFGDCMVLAAYILTDGKLFRVTNEGPEYVA
jgi:hypothetical protein